MMKIHFEKKKIVGVLSHTSDTWTKCEKIRKNQRAN